MRREYWLLMLVAMLLVSLVSGCSVFKPAETIVRDSEEVQAVEGQVSSPDLEADAYEHDGEDAVNDADAEADGDATQTEAASSTDHTPIANAPDVLISSSEKGVTPAAEEGSDAINSEGSDTGADSTAEANDAGASTVAPSTPTLITKSENAVTEAERVELFNTIGFELDELIRLLDSLDTVQESDLNLDEFEE